MTAVALRLNHAFDDYVRFERDAHEKHEFVSGMILAMAGGTLEHSRLTSAVIASLAAQLAGRRCAVLDSNARVRVPSTGNAYYPDATVVCDRVQHDPADPLSLLNPVVVVEVLSPGTADYDRSDKLADYQRIDTLQHVIHVSYDAQRIDVWSRGAQGWRCVSHEAGSMATLSAIGCTLDVSALYRDPLAELADGRG